MGHYYNPPSPHIGAAQPLEPKKLNPPSGPTPQNPPFRGCFIGTETLVNWTAAVTAAVIILPQLLVPQPAAAAVPYNPARYDIIRSWDAPAPAPITAINLKPPISGPIPQNPPIVGARIPVEIQVGWIPPAPAPIVAINLNPPISGPAPQNPPFPGTRVPVEVQVAWIPPPPAPIVAAKFPQSASGSGAPLFLDGSASVAGSSGTSATVGPITSTKANGKVVVIVLINLNTGTAGGSSDVTSITGGGLTFTRRALAANTSLQDIQEWVADVGSSPLSSVTLTINVGSSAGYISASAFVVSATDGTAVSFDSNGPQTSTSSSPAITTSGAVSMVVGGSRYLGTSAPTAGTGWTGICSGVTSSFLATEYQLETSIGTYTPVWTAGDGNAWVTDSFLSPGGAAAATPYNPARYDIIRAWDSPAPVPIKAANLNPPISGPTPTNPPLIGARIPVEIQVGWIPPPPAPIVAVNLNPPIGVATPQNPPFTGARVPVEVQVSWLPLPPAPILPVLLNPPISGPSPQNPPVLGSVVPTAVQVSWLPLPPAPIVAVNLNPPISAPVTQTPVGSFVPTAVLVSWLPPAPAALISPPITPPISGPVAQNPPIIGARVPVEVQVSWQRWKQDNEDPSSWIKAGNITATFPPPVVIPDDGIRGAGGGSVLRVLTRKRWRELLAEFEREAADTTKSKKAVLAVKKAKATIVEAIDNRVVPYDMGAELAQLTAAAESATRATQAIVLASRIIEEIKELYDEEEEIMLMLLS